MSDAVKLEELFFRLGDFSFENINFTLPENHFVGIIGPNGSGKTTLLKLILGFLNPEKGKISLFGKKLREVKEPIGYVPQNSSVDKSFPITVKELLMLGGVSKTSFGFYPKELKKRARELISLFNLEQYHDKGIGKLSGGQFQKALLARALLLDPKLLILDEPTANVDMASSREIFRYLSMVKNKKTILMVTHDIETILNYADSILLVQNGIRICSTEEICKHYSMGLYHPPLKRKIYA